MSILVGRSSLEKFLADHPRAADLSRRELLKRLAQAGVVAPFAFSAMEAAEQAPSQPQGVRFKTKPIVSPSDLRFAGFYRVPGEMSYAYAAFARRSVNGKTRLFTNGGYNSTTRDWPLVELEVPGSAPGMDPLTAPPLQIIRAWPNYRAGHVLTNGSNNPNYPGGMYWDEARNAVWWTYADAYVPVQHFPSVGATVLNDAAGTIQSFGPWRTAWLPQRTLGSFTDIPEWFAPHVGGKRIALSAFPTSGAVRGPWGACLSATSLPVPGSTPPDAFSDQQRRTLPSQGLILHDIDHRQSRNSRYKLCAWKEKYVDAAGAYLEPGQPIFGSQDPGSGTNDGMGTCVWIDLPDKHGVLFFGGLAGTPANYVAPHDPDGLVHIWYGKNICAHGQVDPYHQATGPGTNYRILHGWIYDPVDFQNTAAGRQDLWSPRPKSDAFEFSAISSAFLGHFPSGAWGGNAVLDSTTRRIYIPFKNASAQLAAVFEVT